MIPRLDYSILLATADQGTGAYDHLRGLAVHARALNPTLATEERGWGRLERWDGGSWSLRRSFQIRPAVVEDGPSPALGLSAVWRAAGMMAFPDMENAVNGWNHVLALAQQGEAVIDPVSLILLPNSERVSSGRLHQCGHEEEPPVPCVLLPENQFRIGFTVPDGEQWVAGEAVAVDDIRLYEGSAYRCLQAHTTQVGWEPPNTPALWELVA